MEIDDNTDNIDNDKFKPADQSDKGLEKFNYSKRL
jgi:hypothetical protein